MSNKDVNARLRVNVKSKVVPSGLGLGVFDRATVIASSRTVRASGELVERRNVLYNVSDNAGITTTLHVTGLLNRNGAIIAILPSANRHCFDARLFSFWYRKRFL